METINSYEKSKAGLGEKIKCSVEVITPVHVGSGNKLVRDFDFVSSNNRTRIISKDQLENHLLEHPEDLEKFNNPNFKPTEILERIDECRTYYLEIPRSHRELNEFIRTGLGIPYLPGSSIKGAIRTALLKYFFDKKDKHEQDKLLAGIKAKRKINILLEEIFGKDAKTNLMRTLLPGDVHFNDDQISLEKIYILNLSSTNGSEFKWKKTGYDKKNQNDFKDATPIFAEMITPGSQANFTFKLDSFLLSDREISKTIRGKRQTSSVRKELKFKVGNEFDITEIAKIINNYSLEKLRNEISFLSKLKRKDLIKEVVTELIELEKKVSLNVESNKSNEFYLRVAWGTGWDNMTGDILNEEWQLEFRKIFGRKMNYDTRNTTKQFPIFPKSRKIVFEDNTPMHLTGWIKVRLNNTVDNTNGTKVSPSAEVMETGENDIASKLSHLGRIKKDQKKRGTNNE